LSAAACFDFSSQSRLTDGGDAAAQACENKACPDMDSAMSHHAPKNQAASVEATAQQNAMREDASFDAETEFAAAILRRDLASVRRLAPLVDFRAEPSRSEEMLSAAIWTRNVGILRAVLPRVDATAPGPGGRTHLIMAVESGWPAGVEALLAVCDARAATSADGMTALMIAAVCVENAVECTRLLLPHSSAKAVDHSGRSALHWAASRNSEVVAELLAAGDPLLAAKNGSTPLMVAIEHGKEEAINILVPVSDLSAKDNSGKTPLDLAIEMSIFNPNQSWTNAIRQQMALNEQAILRGEIAASEHSQAATKQSSAARRLPKTL